MKISYYVPKGKKGMKEFIDKELATAKNIQDTIDRRNIIEGLTKIKNNLIDGKMFFWNGSSLEIYDYFGKQSFYHCGRIIDYSPMVMMGKGTYLLVVMDANELSIGKLQGKRIIPIFHKESNVPRKQDAGGQSANRFQRAREEALKQWLKFCGQKLQEIYFKELK